MPRLRSLTGGQDGPVHSVSTVLERTQPRLRSLTTADASRRTLTAREKNAELLSTSHSPASGTGYLTISGNRVIHPVTDFTIDLSPYFYGSFLPAPLEISES